MATKPKAAYFISLTFLAMTISGAFGAPIVVANEAAKTAEEDITSRPIPVLNRPARSIDFPQVQKRPFCNAFTGCGRKRSGNEQMPREAPIIRDMLNSMENESANNIFDFNSEPAVADIMQQIMSEAKVWDAIQEANRELKKQKAMGHNNFPTFSAQ